MKLNWRYVILFTLFWRGLYGIRIFIKILRYVIVLCTSCKLGIRCSHPVTFGKMLWRYTQGLGDRAAEYCEINTLKPTPWKEEEKMHLRVYKKCILLISHAQAAGAGRDAFGFHPEAARFESCPGHLPSWDIFSWLRISGRYLVCLLFEPALCRQCASSQYGWFEAVCILVQPIKRKP